MKEKSSLIDIFARNPEEKDQYVALVHNNQSVVDEVRQGLKLSMPCSQEQMTLCEYDTSETFTGDFLERFVRHRADMVF